MTSAAFDHPHRVRSGTAALDHAVSTVRGPQAGDMRPEIRHDRKDADGNRHVHGVRRCVPRCGVRGGRLRPGQGSAPQGRPDRRLRRGGDRAARQRQGQDRQEARDTDPGRRRARWRRRSGHRPGGCALPVRRHRGRPAGGDGRWRRGAGLARRTRGRRDESG